MGASNFYINTGELPRNWVPDLMINRKTRPSEKRRHRELRSLVTVETLVAATQPLPSHAILLGQCQDNLPFLMELGDPEIGAVLIGCDPGYGKTHQLQVIVDSAIKTHTPIELQILVLTLNPTEWSRFEVGYQYSKYMLGIHAWYDPKAEERIQSLTSLAEARRDGQKGRPSIMVILDDLNYVEDLSLETQSSLRWLLAYGAQSELWLVSTISTRFLQDFQYWIEPCRTRILGRIKSQQDAEILSNRLDTSVKTLFPGEFTIWTGKGWMKYHLPLLGG